MGDYLQINNTIAPDMAAYCVFTQFCEPQTQINYFDL